MLGGAIEREREREKERERERERERGHKDKICPATRSGNLSSFSCPFKDQPNKAQQITSLPQRRFKKRKYEDPHIDSTHTHYIPCLLHPLLYIFISCIVLLRDLLCVPTRDPT